MSLVDRVKGRVARARERSPQVDHAVRTHEHFTAVDGNQHAGGVTYYAFLSVFPVLALAFFVVGWVARAFPDAQDALLEAVEQVLPGLIGSDEGQVQLSDIEGTAGRVGLIGLVGVLYTGLGWLSSLRRALVVVFEKPEEQRLDFLAGKLRDLVSLLVLGGVLLTSVAVSGVITRFSGELLGWAGLGSELGWLLTLLALALGLAVGTLLFFLIFRFLARPSVDDRALWSGALLGAVGFELLKQLSGLLLAGTAERPAFQAFGIALILLVWINYFSRVVLYAAAWAHTIDSTADEGEPDEARA